MNLTPPFPVDELQRLGRLQALAVLDTAPEPLFDTFTRQAAELCGAPIGVLSLLDDRREWFKAHWGLVGVSELPREPSFCACTVAEASLFELADATLDRRFSDHPWVAGVPRVRFYAGVPLQLADGSCVGALSVMCTQPRRLDDAQARALRGMAQIAVQALELRARQFNAQADDEHFLRVLADSLPLRIAYIDRQRRYRFANRELLRHFGRSRDDVIGRTRAELQPDLDDAPLAERARAVLGGQSQQFEFEDRVAGALRRFENRLIPDRDASGEVCGFFVAGIDITERNAAKHEAQRQTDILRSVTEAIPSTVVVVGADGRYRFVNGAFERYCGLPREQILGRTAIEVLGEAEVMRRRPFMKQALGGEAVHFTLEYPAGEGNTYLALSCIPLFTQSGEVDGFVGVSQDVTQQKREEDRLLQLAQRDPLTGLLNRAGFEQGLELMLHQADHAGLAVLYIDLDDFKPVNDRHGHATGDQVLAVFARRLAGLVRPTDMVARIGGDEFAIALGGLRDASGAELVADKVLAAARTPIHVGPLTLGVSASVGVSFSSEEKPAWRELLAQADAQLLAAKALGKGRRRSSSSTA